jgi:hypothetical protein
LLKKEKKKKEKIIYIQLGVLTLFFVFSYSSADREHLISQGWSGTTSWQDLIILSIGGILVANYRDPGVNQAGGRCLTGEASRMSPSILR